MKKLTKILASVLTTAMAVSTVVMPMTAEAAVIADADKIIWNDSALIGTTAGNNGKDTSDVVKTISSQWRPFGYGATMTVGAADVVTYEAQVCIPAGSSVKFLVWNGAADASRATIQMSGGNVTYSTDADTSSNASGTSSVTYENNKWFTVAIERTAAGWNMYANGSLVGVKNAAYAGGGIYTKDFGFDGVSGTVYIDNIHVYKGEYDAANDVVPAAVSGTHKFFAETMTVAEVKAEIMKGQDASKAVARVYKDAVGGKEAEDTNTIGAGWYVVVTSLSGSYYNASDIYKVVNPVEVTYVVYEGSTVEGSVKNNVDTVVPSMTMILVEDGGKVVYSSETKTDIAKGTATFTITGVDSLSNAEVFFVKDWSDPYAVLDNLFDVSIY